MGTAIVKTAKTITQTDYTGSNYTLSEWSNLSTISTKDSNVATANVKDYSIIPKKIVLTDFGFNLPDYAILEGITLKITSKIVSNNHETVNGFAPQIKFTNIGDTITRHGYTLYSETKELVTQKYTFGIEAYDYTVDPSRIKDLILEIGTDIGYGEGVLQISYVEVGIIFRNVEYIFEVTKSTNQRIHKDDTFDIGVSLDSTIVSLEKPITKLPIPSGVEFVSATGNSVVKKGNDLIITHSLWNKHHDTTLTFKAITEGVKTFSFTDSVEPARYDYNLLVTVHPEDIVINTFVPYDVVENTAFEFDIRNTNNGDATTSRTMKIYLPDGLTLNTAASHGDGTYEQILISGDPNYNKYLLWTIPANTKVADYTFNFTPTVPGYVIIKSSDELRDVTVNDELKITPDDYTIPFYVKHELSDEVIDRMEGGVVYSLETYMKVTSEQVTSFEVYNYNFRVCVYNGPTVASAAAEIAAACSLGNVSDPVNQLDVFRKCKLNFIYNDDYPVHIYYLGEYIEQDTTVFDLSFTSPVLEEQEYYENKGVETPGVYFNTVKNLVVSDNPSEIYLGARKNSSGHVIHGFEYGGLEYVDNVAFTGLEIDFECDVKNQSAINMKLYAKNGTVKGERSIILKPGTKNYKLGGEFDLFGVKYVDFISNLQDNYIELTAINATDTSNYILLDNISIKIYYSIFEKGVRQFYIDDESSQYYMIHMTPGGLTFNPGTNNEVKYFNVEGNDETVANRMNITPNEIELEFMIYDCDFEDATNHLRHVAKWFSNKRDKYNKPIPKTIRFDHMPDIAFDYIMEDALEETEEYGAYTVKAKLQIPTGTHRDIEYTYTSNSGVVEGIGRISPTLQVLAKSTNITITEHFTNQSFSIRNSDITDGDLLIIDCYNRTVTHETPYNDEYISKDITGSVDFDSDWFTLDGDFLFETGECAIIQAVMYRERGA